MKVWLLKDGEPFGNEARPMRTQMLARALLSRGHDVTWWTSTFSHARKQLIYTQDQCILTEAGFRVRLIHAGTYRHNISMSRIIHHWRTARRFRSEARCEERPDILVACLPTLDLVDEAVRYGAQQGIPVIVDVRDPWPEVFVHKTPAPLRPMVRAACRPLFATARRSLCGASGITAVSQGYLDWALAVAGRQRSAWDRVFHLGFDDGCHSSRPVMPAKGKAEVVFTFVGTFGHSYDLITVCKAAELALQSGLPARFVLVGDGEQSGRVRKIAERLPNLTCTGWLTGDRIRAVLKESDVGLVPCKSVDDTLPNKPFEYFAFGIPVVSSLRGEMAAIISRDRVGLSYRDGDVKGLLDIVRRLTRDQSLRQEMGRNAYRLFEAQFRAKRIYKEFCKYLENVLGDHVIAQATCVPKPTVGAPSPAV